MPNVCFIHLHFVCLSSNKTAYLSYKNERLKSVHTKMWFSVQKKFINQIFITMAKPIKNTPVLRGKEAINFYKSIDSNRDKKVSADTLNSIRTDASKLREILKEK